MIRVRGLIAVVVGVLVMSGCQTAPTRVSETQIREFDILIDKTQRPLEIDKGTVILDARRAFDYGLNRINGSLHMTWDALAETAESGELPRDPRKAALRLSLNGLQPRTPVIVVGYGTRGQGEEGRLAWALLYYGFVDVQVAAFDVFRKNWTTADSSAPENAPVWHASPRGELVVSQQEFTRWAQDPKARMEKRVFIVDVRSQAEYFNKPDATGRVGAKPDIGAIHIPWTQFYSADGRPDAKIKTKLQALGIQPHDRILLVSNRGVRSGAAAYALMALGFSKVQNYVNGWRTF